MVGWCGKKNDECRTMNNECWSIDANELNSSFDINPDYKMDCIDVENNWSDDNMECCFL